jgi:hypothetical protein
MLRAGKVEQIAEIANPTDPSITANASGWGATLVPLTSLAGLP